MTKKTQSGLGESILSNWQRLNRYPGGNRIFSFIMGKRIPYSSSISPLIISLKPGHATVLMRDRKKVRNHLNSIHAIALVNLGEMASGLALLSGLPNNVKGIVTNINIDYVKKARGNLISEGKAIIPDVTHDISHKVESVITNSNNEIVAKVQVTWQLGIK